MTFSPDQLIATLSSEPESETKQRAVHHLERMKTEGCKGMSLGTYAPGREPRSWTEWAKHFADLQDYLVSRTPEQNAADRRAGEDFLKLDSALCQRDWALHILAGLVVAGDKALDERVRKTFSGDALSYYENSLSICGLGIK